MKKFLVAGAIVITLFVFILPISLIMIRQGFSHSGKSWAPGMVMKGVSVQMACSRYRTAAFALERALTTWPSDVDQARLTYRLALCWEKAGEDEKAAMRYQEFLAAWPNHEWATQAKRRMDLLLAK